MLNQKKSTPEEAAYHEAGHCYVAVRDAGRIVNWMDIQEEDDGWSGTTNIVPDYQNLLTWTTIAVAGIAAEARQDANRRFPEEKLIVTGDLVEQVKDYVDEAEKLARNKKKVLAVQINFPTEGGQQAVSAISISDVRQITLPYRDRWSLQTSLGIVVSIVQNDRYWADIDKLAQALLKKQAIGRDEIETFLGLR
ncbi:hypothetical protein ACYFX5_26780 [Bremerella sp. T1]|uniref:hypothetical protein n=1 Tax=Bremerella sp. TYQ1 TaxID=3119568 RepID=UPI001CCCB84D|nr:hypothetical protein [Bremerella volcania]UBM36615.1 hypothetical protein LA756_01635 [Bremerella volcania]